MNTNGKQSGIFTQRGFDDVSRGSRRAEAETLLVQEVEELKGRAVQMEKTMRSVLTVFTRLLNCCRWWSECAANWREKWTKVRLERNKAIDEAREMRSEAGRMEKERDRVRWMLEVVELFFLFSFFSLENKMLRLEIEEIRCRGERKERTNLRIRDFEYLKICLFTDGEPGYNWY